jgi:hypothetical protein
MKTWYARLRILALIGEGKPLTPSWQRRIAGSGELQRFARSAVSLERVLKQEQPDIAAPAFLHAKIMRAVRAAGQPAPRRSWVGGFRWLPAPAVAVAVVLGVWHVTHPVPEKALSSVAAGKYSLEAAAVALDYSAQMTRRMPSAAVAPLSDELQRVNRDLNNTVDFIVASLP